MNKSENKTEVEEFLREARELIWDGLVFFVPREENRHWVNELGMVTEQVWGVLERLTANNYHRGPEEDRDRGAEFLWKFGCTIDKRETYIKLKIEASPAGKFLKCLSFHEAQFALEYPLRPPPHERGN